MKTIKLRARKVKKKRVAVVMLPVDEKCSNSVSPRLLAELTGVLVKCDGIRKLGSEILESWAGRPMRRNSV